MKSRCALPCHWYMLSRPAVLPWGRYPLQGIWRKLYRPALLVLRRRLERHPRYPASKINVATARKEETCPNISLFMCLHCELSGDPLVDTIWLLTRIRLPRSNSRNCSVLPVDEITVRSLLVIRILVKPTLSANQRSLSFSVTFFTFPFGSTSSIAVRVSTVRPNWLVFQE